METDIKKSLFFEWFGSELIRTEKYSEVLKKIFYKMDQCRTVYMNFCCLNCEILWKRLESYDDRHIIINCPNCSKPTQATHVVSNSILFNQSVEIRKMKNYFVFIRSIFIHKTKFNLSTQINTRKQFFDLLKNKWSWRIEKNCIIKTRS